MRGRRLSTRATVRSPPLPSTSLAVKQLDVANKTYAAPEMAAKKYVEHINMMKEKYGYDANKEPEPIGGQ